MFVFLWVPKVTGSTLSGCILLGMGSNPAAVWVFNQNYASQATIGRRTKELINVCFFMGSKGNGKHFVGLHFAWHGLESCFLWVPKVTGSILSGCICLAWARILLLFECFEGASEKAPLATILPGLVSLGMDSTVSELRLPGFYLACSRMLLAFECFGTAPPVRENVPMVSESELCLAGYRVPDKRINVFYGFQR